MDSVVQQSRDVLGELPGPWERHVMALDEVTKRLERNTCGNLPPPLCERLDCLLVEQGR